MVYLAVVIGEDNVFSGKGHVEQSHAANIMLLYKVKKCIKNVLCGKLFGSHTCLICTNGAYSKHSKKRK